MYKTCLIILLILNNTQSIASPDNNNVNHVVLVWLKPGVTQETVDNIVEMTRELASIPGVKGLSVGNSIASKRTIVDSSFDIGIYMHFDNIKEMERYLSHPLHVHFVETYIKPHVKNIIVYDF